MRHEYENGEAKEVMTFREPEIPQYLKVMAEQKAANMAFYADTELGRRYLDARDEWEELNAEERTAKGEELFKSASPEDLTAFYRKDLAGLGATLDLLESLEIDGETIDGAEVRVLKSPTRRRELEAAHAKMFEDEGA